MSVVDVVGKQVRARQAEGSQVRLSLDTPGEIRGVAALILVMGGIKVDRVSRALKIGRTQLYQDMALARRKLAGEPDSLAG